jgi:hypothetical protein
MTVHTVFFEISTCVSVIIRYCIYRDVGCVVLNQVLSMVTWRKVCMVYKEFYLSCVHIAMVVEPLSF